MTTYRGDVLNIPAQLGLPWKVHQIQEVVHYHLSDDVMPRKTVKIVNREVELSCGKFGIRHGEEEDLIKNWVQSLSMHLGLVLGLAVRKKVDFNIGIRGPRKVLGRKILCTVDLDYELLQIAVVFQDEMDAATGSPSTAAVLLAV